MAGGIGRFTGAPEEATAGTADAETGTEVTALEDLDWVLTFLGTGEEGFSEDARRFSSLFFGFFAFGSLRSPRLAVAFFFRSPQLFSDRAWPPHQPATPPSIFRDQPDGCFSILS